MSAKYLLSMLRRGLVAYVAASALILAVGGPATVYAVEDRVAFEVTLKDTFPGSFKLYEGLSVDDKSKVLKEYKKTTGETGMGRFSTVIAKILELSTEAR